MNASGCFQPWSFTSVVWSSTVTRRQQPSERRWIFGWFWPCSLRWCGEGMDEWGKFQESLMQCYCCAVYISLSSVNHQFKFTVEVEVYVYVSCPFVVFSLRSRPMPSEVWHIRTFASLIGFTKSQNCSGASGANASWLRGPWCLLNSNDDRRLIKVIESDWCSLASDDLNWWFVFIVRILAWTHHFDCISQGYNDYRLTDPHEGYEIIHHWVTGCYGQATLESH